MLLETRHDALTVPSRAVQHGPSSLYVYVVKPDSTVARQDIEMDQDTGKVAVITKGLAAGDKVVLTGQSRLQNGSRVAEAVSPQPGEAQPTKTGS
jgi:multidrug efflux system membrane fusion protein